MTKEEIEKIDAEAGKIVLDKYQELHNNPVAVYCLPKNIEKFLLGMSLKVTEIDFVDNIIRLTA